MTCKNRVASETHLPEVKIYRHAVCDRDEMILTFFFWKFQNSFEALPNEPSLVRNIFPFFTCSDNDAAITRCQKGDVSEFFATCLTRSCLLWLMETSH